MTDYYFDATLGDDDANDGLSEAEPWQTMAKFWSTTLSAGDICYFKRGERFQYLTESLKTAQSGTSTANTITLRDYGDADDPAPIISGNKRLTGSWTNEGTVNGLEIFSWDTSWSASHAGTYLWVDDWVHGSDIANSPSDGTKIPWDTDVATTFAAANKGDYVVNSSTIYIAFPATTTDPETEHTVDAGGSGETPQHLFRVLDGEFWDFLNLTFEGGYNRMFRWGHNNTGRDEGEFHWSYCTFQKFQGNGIVLDSDGSLNTSTYEARIDNCLFYNTPEAGGGAIMSINTVGNSGNGHTLTIEDNVFLECDHGIQCGNGVTSGICTGNIRYNLFIRTKDDAIWSSGNTVTGSSNLDIHYNIIIHPGDQGIQFFCNTADGVRKTRLWNNTITQAGQSGISFRGVNSTCLCWNNLLYNNNRGHTPSQLVAGEDIDYEIEDATGGGSFPAVDYNLVWSDATMTLRTVSDATPYVEVEDSVWADYQTESGQDANGVSVDPLTRAKVPLAALDVELSSESPAVGAGTTVGATRDFSGNAVPATPSIGALEYVERPKMGAGTDGMGMISGGMVGGT